MAESTRKRGQHALEKASPDRTNFQRGRKVRMKTKPKRRKKSKK